LTVTLALLLASLGIHLAVAQDYKDQVRDYPPDVSETFRAALPEDFYPGGEPALGPLPGTISIFDVVVSNTNKNLKKTNTTANGEPSIAVNPANTNEIAHDPQPSGPLRELPLRPESRLRKVRPPERHLSPQRRLWVILAFSGQLGSDRSSLVLQQWREPLDPGKRPQQPRHLQSVASVPDQREQL
jgi:hypothetical protein